MNNPIGDSSFWFHGVALSLNSGASYTSANGSVVIWKQWLI